MSRIVDEAERATGKTRCYGYGSLEGRCINEALPDRPWCKSCERRRKVAINSQLRDIEARFDEIFTAMEKSHGS
jgi:hypothetical protein